MDYLKSVADEYKPWRKGVAWWVVAAQGAIVALIGLYFLIAPDSANSTIRFLLAAILILSSLVDIRSGFNGFNQQLVAPQPLAPYLLLRGGAGIAMGVTYFVSTHYDYVSEENARYLLGFGLIAYAVIGLIGAVVAVLKGRFTRGVSVSNALFLAIGAVLLYNNQESVDSEDSVRYLGLAALLGGVALLAYSWFAKTEQEAAAATVPPTGDLPIDPLTGLPLPGAAMPARAMCL